MTITKERASMCAYMSFAAYSAGLSESPSLSGTYTHIFGWPAKFEVSCQLTLA